MKPGKRKKIKKNKPFKSKMVVWPYILTGIIVVVIGIVISLIVSYCKVTKIFVDGNVHYTNDEIAAMVMDGWMGDNSIYLFLKYRDKEIKDVPFVETMSVSIEAVDTIRITVYEKSLAGYVEYLDRYLYFDRAGTVVESSQIMTMGIPKVTGLTFDHAVLYEPLPVENPLLFETVLDVTQLMHKYSLSVDQIHFLADDSLVLFFGDIEVDIGDDSFIDEKVMVLPDILSKLQGKKGVINLTEYESGDTITFENSN